MCFLFHSCIDDTFYSSRSLSFISDVIREFISFAGFIGKRNIRAGEQRSSKVEV